MLIIADHHMTSSTPIGVISQLAIDVRGLDITIVDCYIVMFNV